LENLWFDHTSGYFTIGSLRGERKRERERERERERAEKIINILAAI